MGGFCHFSFSIQVKDNGEGQKLKIFGKNGNTTSCITRNVHVKYESPTSYKSKVKANDKVFRKR